MTAPSRGRPELAPAEQGASVAELILEAVAAYGAELPELAFLPELRYDRRVFPTHGQYDWLAGQVLYAIVRHVRPRRLVEFSTSSGYSTTFGALAMRRNGTGRLQSVDVDATALDAAARWLERNGLADLVELHRGDCRDVVPALLGDDVDLLFVDTLHSFAIAEWYLTTVVPRLRPEALVHVHDVMPPEARVRIHGGPPYRPAPPWPRPPLEHLIKRFVWLAIRLRWPNPFPYRPPREMLPLERLEVHPADGPGALPTIDGNYFEEALVIRELLRHSHAEEFVYLHRLEPRLLHLEPQRFAHTDLIHRTDRWGNPLEWNDALWCRAASLRRLAEPRRVRRLVRDLRREYYGRPRAIVAGAARRERTGV